VIPIPDELLAAVCRIPLAIRGWTSPKGAVRESGYADIREQVTPGMVAEYLRRHSELIEAWETYSLDKRTSGGWYFLREPRGWRVGSISVSYPDEEFASAAEACAEFVLREVESIYCALSLRTPLWPKSRNPPHREPAV
jgi:hypothetical protein